MFLGTIITKVCYILQSFIKYFLLDRAMTGWEIKDLLGMLQKAQEGDIRELNHMTASYTSGCTVDKEYGTMIIRRQFRVENQDNERCILNSEPNQNGGNESSDEQQWGISIIQLSPKGGSTNSYCIPNNLRNPKIRLLDQQTLDILSDEKTITTTISEIEKKLKPIYGIATENEIEEAFNTLSCQQYVIPSIESIDSKAFGTLELEEEEYGTVIKIDDIPVRITIFVTVGESLSPIIDHAEKLMAEKFYEKAIRSMYPSMLELKNDYWLEEPEDESDAEPTPLTLEEFKERITITEIAFNQDKTTTIICSNDDMFEDHDIVISTDTRGVYKDSALAE